MTPFGPVPEPPPAAPIDIPVPEVPAANFQTIGQQIGLGIQQAEAVAKAAPAWFDWIGDLIGKIVGSLLALVLAIIAKLMQIINVAWATADGGTDAVAAEAVSGLMGVPVTPGAFSAVTNPAAREAVASAISQQILTKITGGQAPNPLGGLQPGHQAQLDFLTTASHLAIEGWLQGWLFEACSVGQIETFAELKDIMAHVLGMGRIAHTMLAPTIKVTVTDPALWELNLKYRPTRWKDSDGVYALNYTGLRESELNTHLQYQGYSDDQIASLKIQHGPKLSPAELHILKRYEANFSGGIAPGEVLSEFARGIQQAQFDAIDNAELARIENEMAALAVLAFTERKIDQADFQAVLDGLTFNQSTKQYYLTLAQLKLKYNEKRVSVGEAATLVKQGIWGLDQWAELMAYYGYVETDIQDLQILIFAEEQTLVAKEKAAAAAAAARQARQAAAAAKLAAEKANAVNIAEAKGISIKGYEALVMDGLKTVQQFAGFLSGKGLAADNITALTTVLQNELAAAKASGATVNAAGAIVKAKGLSLSQMEQAYLAGIISAEEYTADLTAAGVPKEDAAVLLQLANNKLAVQQAKEGLLSAAQQHANVKGVSLADELLAVKQGIVSVDEYQSFIAAHGFSEEAQAVLVDEAKNALAAATKAAATKAATAPGGPGKGVTLAELARAVRGGLATIGDYSKALQDGGYNTTAVTELTGLLQQQLDADKVTRQARAIADASLATEGIAIADLERAVRLGVLTVATYQAVLTAAHVPAAAQNILTLSLAAQIKSTKAAQGVAGNVRALVSATGLSLGTLEKQVYAGKLTLPQFTAELQGAGVSAADVAAVVKLVQDELDQMKATEALQGKAAAAAGAKRLSLAEMDAAVKAGVKTLTDYEAFVGNLGFNSADVATLTATLAASSAYQKLVAAGTAPAYTG